MVLQSSEETTVSDISPQVQFHGRWDLTGEDRYISHWCGSSLCFQTTSRSITVELGGLTVSRSNFHNVLWRFGSQSVTRTALVKGKRSMKFTALSDAAESGGGEKLRDVTIMLCDWGAKLQILDIKTTDGRAILAPAVASSPRPMLFIGDSLVSGFTPLYRGLVLPHGSYQSFGSIAVRTLRAHGLDARLEMVAYPGICLKTVDSPAVISTQAETDMDWKGDEVYWKGMEDVFWDGMIGKGGWEERSRDTPHDIFICVGTNDQGWGGDKNEFVEHYAAFLIRLRDSYPSELQRIHVISPFGAFNDPSDPLARKPVIEPAVQHMVEQLAKSWAEANPNGTKLYHISTEGWIHKGLTCDGVHPTSEGHEVIGTKLIEYMDSLGLAGVPGIHYTGSIP
ncbi:hypothetical protein Clacol_009012 [Clathrus columnatus]|uniref:SGNH hydrolase-type esterase domain-containing protein n=1 Tax=Clathrus columnatus TaxID=1419009 RepID=A0AAV5AK32_9AGAM|nr:hypothetical protein Clacol_009012 [Clathrus columnatus]